jgi:hypothetical protein
MFGRCCFATSLVYLFAGVASAREPQQDLNLVRNQTGADSYTVVYTGHLFGYYRFPEVETMQPATPGGRLIDGCFGEIKKKDAPEAFRFGEALKVAGQDTAGTTLRVSMGDNFAPFLLARQMWKPDEQMLVGKEQYVGLNGEWNKTLDLKQTHPAAYRDILNGGGSIPMDNVGCFLRRMEFDAVVPGEHDFLFGPARLRFLAQFLADPARPDEGLAPAKMLGVNLFLQTRVIAPASQSADSSVPDSKNHPPIRPLPSPPRVTTPKKVLPWMRSVQIQGWIPGPAGAEAQACVVDIKQLKTRLNRMRSDFADFTDADELKICEVAEFALTLKGGTSPQGYSAWIPGDRVLQSDTDYAVAILLSQVAGPSLIAWQPFSVVPPFFGYAAGTKTAADADRPWVTKLSKDGKAVSVFGVVDPSLMQFVGQNNSIWLEEEQKGKRFPLNDHYETDVVVGDPAEALKQAVEYCEQFQEV